MSEKQLSSMGVVALVSVPVLADVDAGSGMVALTASSMDDYAKCHSDCRLSVEKEHIPTSADEDGFGKIFEIPVSNYVRLKFDMPQKMEFVFIDN